MRRTIWVGLLAVAGCTAEEGGTIEMIGVAAPDEQCNFKSETDEYVGSGWFDPWGSGLGEPNGFFMAVIVNNNLSPSEASRGAVYNENVRPTANSVLLTGFEACFVRVDEPVETPTYGAGCESVSEDMSTFIPTTVAIDAGGSALGYAMALTPAHQRQIFGERFSPGDIEPRGTISETVLGKDYNNDGDQTDTLRFLGPELPDASNRSEAWGTYPPQPDALVLVKMRAVGKTQSGVDVESNWMSFGIKVCVGCFTDQCGALVLEDCGGGIQAYTGYYPDWSNFSGCFPYQEGTTCKALPGCP